MLQSGLIEPPTSINIPQTNIQFDLLDKPDTAKEHHPHPSSIYERILFRSRLP